MDPTAPLAETPAMEPLHAAVLAGLETARARLEGARFPVPLPQGKLLRPLIAYAVIPADGRTTLPQSFWAGALAIQMIHEASLLHDDVVDGAQERRGRPSRVCSAGLSAALIEGDHLLTGAYRVVAEHTSPGFLASFCRAVEGTVAGEREQGECRGTVLPREQYERIIRHKSGELFGAALVLAADASGGNADEAFQVGCRIGALYQMVDDVLDLCSGADLGKAPFQDYLQENWTFPLEVAGLDGFKGSVGELCDRLFLPDGAGRVPMRQAVDRLRREGAEVEALLSRTFVDPGGARGLVRGWVDRADDVVGRECAARAPVPVPAGRTSAAPPPRDVVMAEASRLSGTGEWMDYFAHHGTSFRFASRLFPPEPRDVVAGVYAFCRFTDDLVDQREDAPPHEREALLDAWLELSREAYETGTSGVPLLDSVLGDAARHRVPFRYPAELVEGVRMDLTPRVYPDGAALRVYSYRVASVVGLWLTERFGVREPWVLERAGAMGHAMQLSNILRDVGEDLGRGRLYLPLDRMTAHGVERGALESAARHGGPLPSGYVELVEELLRRAEDDYRESLPAVAALPDFFQRPVAVAAHVYRGIHGAIRRNGHDNLTQRAFTSLPRKGVLAARALLHLRRIRRDHQAAGALATSPPWLAREGSGEAA